MKLKQKELKKTMRGIFAGACLLAIGSAVVFAVGTETEMKAYAAEWQQAENGDWTYAEDDGSYATGWQKIGGVWYYLDPESGVWNSHPALDQTSVCYLIENAVNKKGWFNREISEDEIKDLEDELQKITDKYIAQVDKMVEAKSKEIMTV